MGDIWFTSDTHYGHRNIIRYCDRPFARDPIDRQLVRPSDIADDEFDPLKDAEGNSLLDVEAMNRAMIERWNRLVRRDDTVYHLGDLILGQDIETQARILRGQLNGRITLVLGNHDRGAGIYLRAGFESVVKKMVLETEHGLIHMRHHPPQRPIGEHGQYRLMLCGHVHEKWLHKGKVVNVGVDQWDFSPVSLETLLTVND